ncbi:MAG: prepilin-type N-terminal cleavage/methylation domain-containing protein [Clostridiales bacterium]|nr:prepilin-type N-terminal cleavage/methylation domain-containing protein [Clostridiales bacterium]
MTKKKRGRNQGFSLVEVMIAVCVLAIIVIPTLAYFGRAVQNNMLTGQKHKATVAAERLMEEIKGTSTDKIVDNLQNPDGTITNAVSGSAFTVVSTSAVNVLGYRYDCTGKVREGDSVFDAKVEIDPASTSVSSGSSLHTINLSTDVVIDEDSFTSAGNRFYNEVLPELTGSNIANHAITDAMVRSNISKNIIIMLYKQSDTIYKMDCLVSYYVENMSSGALYKRAYYKPDQIIASETIDTNNLKNIYLFYQNYDFADSSYVNMNDIYFQTMDASGNPIPTEMIDFSNVNFYAVCQKAEAMPSATKNSVRVRMFKDETNGLGRGEIKFKNLYFNVPTDVSRVQCNKVEVAEKIFTSLTGSNEVSTLAKVTVRLYKENEMSQNKPYVTLKSEMFFTE